MIRLLPESCETPLHTIDILRSNIERDAMNDTVNSGAKFLNVDIRVLTWLLNDAEKLNRLIAAQIEMGA